jgi:hypothetical protein
VTWSELVLVTAAYPKSPFDLRGLQFKIGFWIVGLIESSDPSDRRYSGKKSLRGYLDKDIPPA